MSLTLDYLLSWAAVASVLIIFARMGWSEFLEWLPKLGMLLIRRAVQVFDEEELRSRFEEEWTAELNAVPGKLSPFLYGFAIWFQSYRLARTASRLAVKVSKTAAVRPNNRTETITERLFGGRAKRAVVAVALVLGLAATYSLS
jgi:hypothetical protein